MRREKHGTGVHGDGDLSPGYCGPLRNLYFHVKDNLGSRLLPTTFSIPGAKNKAEEDDITNTPYICMPPNPVPIIGRSSK